MTQNEEERKKLKKLLSLKAKLLEERKRRLIMERPNYEPNSGQRQVHYSNKRERFVFSGNGAGKTALLVQEMLAAAKGYNPWLKKNTVVPSRIIVVLDSPEKIAKKVIPEIKKWYPLESEQLHKDGKPYHVRISFSNGSNITFMFHDQDMMKFESIEVDCVLFDEPPPRHIYIGLSRGARDIGSDPRFLIVGTPLAGPWLRREIYEPWVNGQLPNTVCFKFHTEVNRVNLREGYIEEFASKLNEKEKRVRLHGDFFDLDGMALAHLFDRSVHLVDMPRWPSGWPCVVAIDPHGRKPHYACLLGVNPDNEYLYLKEINSKLPPRLFAGELKKMYSGYRIVDIICDSLGSGPQTGGDGNLSFIQVLNEEGVRARATSFQDKDDETWTTKIQDVLFIPEVADNLGRRDPKIKFVRDCYGIISDVETVEWVKYKNSDEFQPKLGIENKDRLATLKYALSTNLNYNKGRERIIRTKRSVGIMNRGRR